MPPRRPLDFSVALMGLGEGIARKVEPVGAQTYQIPLPVREARMARMLDASKRMGGPPRRHTALLRALFDLTMAPRERINRAAFHYLGHDRVHPWQRGVIIRPFVRGGLCCSLGARTRSTLLE